MSKNEITSVMTFLAQVKEAFPEYNFEYQQQTREYSRTFITHNGISLGRINFKKESGIYNIISFKHYKPYDYEYETRDDLFYQFSFWLETGKKVEISHLAPLAKEIKNNLVKIDYAWRNANPKFDKFGEPKSRRSISRNWMGTFRKLVNEEFEKQKEITNV